MAQAPSKIASHPEESQGDCFSTEYRCIPDQLKVKNVNKAPISVVSDYAESQGQKKSLFKGDVVITQGHRIIKADTAQLNQEKNVITAKGNIIFNDGDIAIKGSELHSVLDTEDSILKDAQYKMLCSPGRGEAKQVFKNGTTFYQLENGTYTTCPSQDKSWRFSAGKIEKKEDNRYADLYNMRFEVLDTPLMYLPYLRVPVEDGRLTGFLYPQLNFNDINGFEFQTPFYWNIAPQYDLTFTPHYMSERGLFLSSYFRYLHEKNQGDIHIEYMGHDNLFPQYIDSWGINWQHSGLSRHWKYEVDYSKVSDIAYFARHTDSTLGSREDNTLTQMAALSYRQKNWNTSLNFRSFQPLSTGTSIYKLIPQLDFNGYVPDLPYGLNFKMPIQISHFETDALDKPDASRINFEPTLTLPYTLPWLTASAQGRLYYTRYEQSNIKNILGYDNETLEPSITRLVPQAKLNATVILERDAFLGSTLFTQTLEPQLQYLYIKDVDQSGIYNPVNYAGGGYDTARLQTDYFGLFRDNQFSSVDYINPANQFTFGASTRFFDNKFKERFNFAFGQIYYLNRAKHDPGTYDYSAWAVESELNLFDTFSIRGSLEYDSNLSNLQFGNLTTEYRQENAFAQTSYRYVSKDYIASTTDVNNLDLITEDGISQLGFVASVPLFDRFNIQGQYFHDLTQDMMIENQIGISYRSACWSLGISYNQYLLSRDNINDPAKYDDNISLSFSLLGLGTNAGFGYSTASGNALGYRNPFGLRN